MTAEDRIELAGLRDALNKHSGELSKFLGMFETWQQTRCQDHHDRMEVLEVSVANQKIEQTKLIAKAAGVTAVLVGAMNLAIGMLALWQLREMLQ